MNISMLGRYAFSIGATIAMLTACGGSQPPIAAPLSRSNVGVTAERTRPSVNYAVLHSFGGSYDGVHPEAGLINVKGTLYGTTYRGGANYFGGTVFAIKASGAESVLYSFGGYYDGANPEAALINVDGTLYGTTYQGGSNNGGTVFAITTSGKETVLHRFGDSGDGANPEAGLINVKGTLYGTTYVGGDYEGTVFTMKTSGAESVLHSFDEADGANPYAGLINVKGKLYGTTYYGGKNSCGSYHACGTVFVITTSGAEKVLHSFSGGSGDGANPRAGLINVKDTLYGTTSSGGPRDYGTVFKIKPSGAESVLHSFIGSDGGYPYAGLTNVNGTLYGTTYAGGKNYAGTVFAITTSGKETVLHSFGGSGDGAAPEAGLINVNGTLYGTTSYGGAGSAYGYGTVFWIKP